MPRYIRAKTEGASYFFTVVTHARRNLFSNHSAIDILGQSIRHVRKYHPFKVDAWVLLPDHMHCIWTMPENDSDFSTRWRLIKTAFSKRSENIFHKTYESTSRIKRNELPIWQRRFWEHLIRDENDFSRHMDYIHYNPVKHGLVKKAGDGKWSTYHKYAEKGLYTNDWEEVFKPDENIHG